MVEDNKKFDVFISYSHEDEKLVTPIVELISASRQDLVFQDVKHIRKGKKWEPQLLNALTQAHLVIVFWCKHSAGSDYVRSEYENAIKADKDILPVLLDGCALNKSLAEYQWIDLHNIITHPEVILTSPKRSPSLKILKIIVPVFLVLTLAIAGLMIRDNKSNPAYPTDIVANKENKNDIHVPPRQVEVKTKDISHTISSSSVNTWPLIIIVLLVAIFVSFMFIRGKRRRIETSHEFEHPEIIASKIVEGLNEKLPVKR